MTDYTLQYKVADINLADFGRKDSPRWSSCSPLDDG